MNGVSGTAKILMAAVWVIAMGVMAAAFIMMTGERRREFAVLRVLGASGKKLNAIVLGEGITLSGADAAAGAAAGVILILVCSGWMEKQLNLPFLLPGAGSIVLDAVLALCVTTLTGAAAASFAARRISRQDTGTIIRSEE